MLKVAKNHLTAKNPNTTMEALVNDSTSMEAWFSKRKTKSQEKPSGDFAKIHELIRTPKVFLDQKELDKEMKSAASEITSALESLEIDFDSNLVRRAMDVAASESFGAFKMNRQTRKDLSSLMTYFSLINNHPDEGLSHLPIPIENDKFWEEGKFLYGGDYVVLSSEVDGTGMWSVKIWPRFYSKVTDTPSRDRQKAIEDVTVGLYQHLQHVYKSLDHDDAGVDEKDEVFKVQYDNVSHIQDPTEALFDYDGVVFGYDNATSTYSVIIDYKGHLLVGSYVGDFGSFHVS
jgi:hypothetical protein